MNRLCAVLLACLAPALFASGEQEVEYTSSGQPIVDLSITILPKYELGVTKQLENSDNVVTPYLTDRFGLRVNEILKVPSDMTYPQAIAMWRAADMAPDLMQCGAEDFGAMISSGAFVPLDEYLEEMPNYERYLNREYWSREVGPDGNVYAFYNLTGYEWPKIEPPSDDVVSNSLAKRALWVREDVLEAIGYEFTPMMEIKAATTDQGIRPTREQFAIDPPVDSPEAFLEMLRKIKAANLTALDGSEIIPFSMVSWETWHLGVMFDWGYWRINRDSEVDGYLGLPGTRPYMEWLWTAYREGLIDPDYLVHKSVQLQEKVATGMVAAGEYVPDARGTFAQLENNVPGAIRHFIPFPKSSPDYGFFDTYNPQPYNRVLVNKNLPEEVIRQIARFVDWLYTDEGAEILSWGPPEAGLYTERDGRRVFVDPAVEEAVLTGDVDGPGAYKYGLHDPVIKMSSDPLTNALGPETFHHTVFHEYNQTRNFMELSSSIVASNPRFMGVGTKLQVANSDQSEEVQEVADWYWGIFPQTYLPQLLKAQDEEQFEGRYTQMLDAFMRETNYETARARMESYFEEFPPLY